MLECSLQDAPSPQAMQTDEILEALQRDGIAVLAKVISPDQLASMCRTFNRALSRLRLNDLDGFNKTELLRDMVEDVLLLDQAFVDVTVDPLVIEVARRCVGAEVQLVECKGWRSRATRKDWHGWHGDGWYDRDAVGDLPREFKLAFYCYHDPALPLQQEDIEYGRYHPLLLNAAFLGGLSSEQQCGC